MVRSYNNAQFQIISDTNTMTCLSEWIDNSKKGIFSINGGRILHMLVHSNLCYTRSQLESLRSSPDLQCWDRILMNPMSNDYGKLFVSNLMEVSLPLGIVGCSSSIFVSPKPMGLQAFFDLSSLLSFPRTAFLLSMCGLHFSWTLQTLVDWSSAQ